MPNSSIASQNLLPLLLDNMQDYAIFMLDLEGNIVSWTVGVFRLLGYEEEEFVGQNAALIFTLQDREKGAPQTELITAAREGRAQNERWHKRKDGTQFWASGQMIALRNDAGQLRGFAKILRDDTQRKEMEEELRQTAAQLQTALDVGRIGTWRWDIPNDCVVADANLARFFGISPEEARGTPIENYTRSIHPNDVARVTQAISQAIENQSIFSEDYRILQSDGSLLWVEARGKIEFDEAGTPLQLNGVVVDISERKTIEAELGQSDARYRTLFEAIDNGFCVIDVIFDDTDKPVDYRFVEINPTFEKQTGLQNAVGKTMRELVPNLDQYWFETYGKVAMTGESVHFQSAADAMQRFFDIHAFRVGRPEDRRVAVLFTDISDRKKVETQREELLQTLEFERGRLATIFHNAPAFVAVLRGPQHTFEMANPAYYQLVGHRDIIGKPLLQALPEIDGQGFVELLDGVLYSGVPIEGRATPVQLQREPNGALEEHFIDLLYQPILEADGTISGVFAHGVDITEQVSARLSAETANRVKDEFLATLSHELRTPLTAIMGWAHMLKTTTFSAEETARALDTIDRNARAQGQLIEDILDVSRVITGKLRLDVQPLDLTTIIEDAVSTVLPAAQAKGIRLQRVLDSGESIVSGDKARLGQIVWNLLSNAMKFTPKGGRVQVRLERINSHVEIVVWDNGEGIAPDVLPRIFERFQQADSTSTRAQGGLGLGLAIVRHLVELHGGTVDATSEGLGHGAVFTVKLPLLAVRSLDVNGNSEARIHPKISDAPNFDSPPELHGLHVLLVDDQDDTRVFLSIVLEKCGARVSAASSAKEAFAMLQELRPDVLLSDIGMPDEDGFSLLEKVRALPIERGGQTPAAALTAYARVEDRMKVLRSGFQFHVPKPVEPQELIAVVANLAARNK